MECVKGLSVNCCLGSHSLSVHRGPVSPRRAYGSPVSWRSRSHTRHRIEHDLPDAQRRWLRAQFEDGADRDRDPAAPPHRSVAALMCATVSGRRSLRPCVTISRTTSRRAGAVTTCVAAPHGSPRFPRGHLRAASSACRCGSRVPEAPLRQTRSYPERAPPQAVAGLCEPVLPAQVRTLR
jgi:hypothetical protein